MEHYLGYVNTTFMIEGLIVLILLLIICYCSYNAFLHPLHRVPGPFLASLTPLWEVFNFLTGRSHETYVRLHQQYGPIVRVSPNTVLVNDSNSMAAYWNWDKSDWWLAFRANPKHLPHSNVHETSEHSRRKKMVLAGYTLSNALKIEDRIDKHINTFVSGMRDLSGQVFDFAPWAQWAAFDIIMDLGFSNPIHFMQSRTDVDGMIKSMHSLLFRTNIIAFFPSIIKILLIPWIHKLVAPKPGDKSGPGQIHGLAYKQIRRRYDDLEAASKFHDLLQTIIDKNKDNDTITQPVLEQEAIAPILAGTDGVAAHMRTAVLYMATNTAALSRLRSEIDNADAKDLLSEVPQFAQVRDHIPYLELVHKEAMRIYPVVGSYAPRSVPKGGFTASGHFLPAGTSVGVSQWAVSRNKDIFGDDVEVFRPERWNENEFGGNKHRQRIRDLAYIPFSRGPMMCTGHSIAKLEISKILTQIFRLFDIQIVNPLQPFKDMNNLSMIQWDFWVQISERNDAPKKFAEVSQVSTTQTTD